MSLTDVMNVLNQARTNPKAFASTIKKLFIDPVDTEGRHCIWGITMQDGKAGAQQLYDQLNNTQQPVPAIKGNGCMTVSAYDHARYMSDNNVIVHSQLVGHETYDLKARLEKWGAFDNAA